MIDKYLLDDLRLRNDEKGELARWVIQLQIDLDTERRKTASRENRIAELEQRLQQPIKLPPLMPENIFGGTPQAHMVANSHNNAITACSMSIRDAGFKSECTVWKEVKGE